jgi:hypothetical protein
MHAGELALDADPASLDPGASLQEYYVDVVRERDRETAGTG